MPKLFDHLWHNLCYYHMLCHVPRPIHCPLLLRPMTTENLFHDAAPPRRLENIHDIAPSDERWVSADRVGEFSTKRYEFAWNATFTHFIPLPLTWWDDQSYIDYQCGSEEEDPADVGEAPTLPAPVVEDATDDDIPF